MWLGGLHKLHCMECWIVNVCAASQLLILASEWVEVSWRKIRNTVICLHEFWILALSVLFLDFG